MTPGPDLKMAWGGRINIIYNTLLSVCVIWAFLSSCCTLEGKWDVNLTLKNKVQKYLLSSGGPAAAMNIFNFCKRTLGPCNS